MPGMAVSSSSKMICQWVLVLLFGVLLLGQGTLPVVEAINYDEELTFATPAEIKESSKENMVNFAERQKEQGNELSRACERGVFTCLWEEDNPLISKAEAEARARGQVAPGAPSARPVDPRRGGLPGLSRPAELHAREELLLLAGPAAAAAAGGGGGGGGGGEGGALREAGADGGGGEGGEEGGWGGQLTAEMANYLESLEVMEGVAAGALARAEALPAGNLTDVVRRAEKHAHHQYERRNYRHLRDPLDAQWLLATEFQETNRTKVAPYNRSHEQDFLDWFEKGGGRLAYVDFDRDDDGEPLRMVAAEPVGDQDVVLQVPMKLVLGRQTQRLVQTKRGLLKEHFDVVFQRNEEWGLASFLLLEQLKGPESKWAPFIRMLRMRLLRRSVMQELQGTYAGEVYRQWDLEAGHLLAFLRDHSDGPCRHDFNKLCDNMLERSFVRWALWVVKRHAVPVRKLTTGKPFLALVPFAHLVRHSPGAGGNLTLFLDNTVRLSVAEHGAGSAIGYDKGNYSHAEALFRFHAVAPGDGGEGDPHRHNTVHLALPGVDTPIDDLVHNLKRVKDWREMLRYPPSQIDLWMATNHLMIYGDEFDEEEQKVLQQLNDLFEGKPVQVRSEAEYLMLMGGAQDEQEAALVLAGNAGALAEYQAARDPMLYVAIDSEKEGDRQDRALDTLAYSLLQFQDSLVARPEGASVEKVLNRTRDFYVHGVRPLRGFDEIDKMMKRMKQMLNLCGESHTHVIRNNNVTDELFCAMRIHLVNESDLDAMCPAGPAPFDDSECNCLQKGKGGNRECDEYEIYFNASLPISRPNEEKSVAALINSLEALQSGYTTSIDDDESMLSLSTFRDRNAMQAAAVYVRLQEKILVRETLRALYERQDHLDELPYQVEEMKRQQEERKQEEERRRVLNEAMRRKALEPRVLLSVPVDLPGGVTRNLTVHEGEELEALAAQFVRNHSLAAAAVKTLVDAVKEKMPEEEPIVYAFPFLDPYGVKRVVAVYSAQNVSNVTQEACIAYNVSDSFDDEDCANLVAVSEAAYEKRMKLQVKLYLPVTLPDGRSVKFEVREGDHHDLMGFVATRATVYRIPDGFVYGVANEIHKRLPPEVASLPVNLPGRNLQLSIRQGDNIEEAVTAFCELYDLPLENVPQLRQSVMQKLNPGVGFVAKGKPMQ